MPFCPSPPWALASTVPQGAIVQPSASVGMGTPCPAATSSSMAGPVPLSEYWPVRGLYAGTPCMEAGSKTSVSTKTMPKYVARRGSDRGRAGSVTLDLSADVAPDRAQGAGQQLAFCEFRPGPARNGSVTGIDDVGGTSARQTVLHDLACAFEQTRHEERTQVLEPVAIDLCRHSGASGVSRDRNTPPSGCHARRQAGCA